MARERLMIKLRAASAREYTNNSVNARMFKDGFSAGWEAAIDTLRQESDLERAAKYFEQVVADAD